MGRNSDGALDVNLLGVGDMLEQLEASVANASRIENEALKEAAKIVLDEAKVSTAFHDRTGKLRDSLKLSGVRTSKGAKFVLAGVFNKNVNYAYEVEYGHQVIDKNGEVVGIARAHPFLYPAYSKNIEAVKEIIKRRIAEALK